MGTLAEGLAAALDGTELDTAIERVEVEPVSQESAPVESEPAETAEGRARDEHGRFAKTDAETPAKPEQETAQTQQAPQTTEQPETQPDARQMVTPPATWSAGAKAVYATLPEVARKEIAKREADYARGIQQHSEAAKGYQNMMREFQPYEAMIRAENGTPEGAIRDLLKTAYQLRTGTPQERGRIVATIAQQFGADLSPYLGQPQQQAEGQQDLSNVQQYVQQLVSPHLQRIQAWEQQQMTAQQRQQQQVEQETISQIEAFQNATEADGITPKHIYFDNVRGLMSAYFANGEAKTLDQAYEMACWANPEVRAALIAEKQRAADSQRLEEAKRKTATARNSSFDVRGQGGVGIAGSKANESLEDTLAARWAEMNGGVRV